MTFPLGGDFPRAVSGGFNFVASDPERDQGDGFLLSSSPPVGNSIVALLQAIIEKDHPTHQLSKDVQYFYETYLFSDSATNFTFVANLSNQVASSTFMVALEASVSSFWRMAQFNPGDLPHIPGAFSDLYSLDIFSSYVIYQSLVIHFIERLGAVIHQADAIDIFGNLVQTDYYTTISGNVDPCVGDETPPQIGYVEPTISGAVLRPRDQIVEFTLSDAVGGVDISTLSVSVNSTTTTGTIQLVDSGSDLTDGDVSILGTADSFRIRYIPPFLWDYNDTVTVSISGADLPPQVDGDPFFCGASNVNFFVGDIPFRILNEEDLAASLTPVGDTDSPYISFSSPTSGTVGNSVFTDVKLNIADDLTGVDLSSLLVTVDGETVVNSGLPNSETSIVGSSAEYQITYNPAAAFTYGSTVTVIVEADDLVDGAPNHLSTAYDFSFIDDSTLTIENFQPGVGTHHNLHDVDIKVDITDDTYGVDASQSFLVINGTIVSGTQSVLTSGIQITYHPPNDFSFDEPIRVTVHGTNNNFSAPVVKEDFFTLYFGCRVFLFNEEPYKHADDVTVFVRARNIERFHKDLSSGYFFSTYTQPQSNLGASIEAINPIADLPATISGVGPEHRYGETITVEFSVEDLDGRLLGPYTFVYTIEDRPD